MNDFPSLSLYSDITSWAMLGEEGFPTVLDAKGALRAGLPWAVALVISKTNSNSLPGPFGRRSLQGAGLGGGQCGQQRQIHT